MSEMRFRVAMATGFDVEVPMAKRKRRTPKRPEVPDELWKRIKPLLRHWNSFKSN